MVYRVPDAAGILGSQCPRLSVQTSSNKQLQAIANNCLPADWAQESQASRDFMAGWAETEFQRQATAAFELHRHVLERHRLRASHEYNLKAEKLWKALADLQELLKAMEQQLEVCQSEGALDSDALEKESGAPQRLLALQQRLLEQQAAARELREQIAANTVKERLAQEAEVQLLSEAQAFEVEMQSLRAKLLQKHRDILYIDRQIDRSILLYVNYLLEKCEVQLPPRTTLRARPFTPSSLRPFKQAKGMRVAGARGQGVGGAEWMDQEGGKHE